MGGDALGYSLTWIGTYLFRLGLWGTMGLLQREADAEFARQALAEKRMTRNQLHECAGAQMGLRDQQIRRALPVLAFELGFLERPSVEKLIRHVLRRCGPVRLGGFSVEQQIGRGGMGVVYRACQNSLHRDVAVKVLLRRDMKPEFVDRFRKEGQIAAKLQHTNLVHVLEIGDAEGWHYIAMEYIDGPTLTKSIAESGPMSEFDALTLASKIASALHHAHETGIVHRDVKPGNIMYTRAGEPKLCDLGLAQHRDLDESELIARGVTVGSKRYMSPEQVRGLENVDHRTDIYSLGLAVFFALTGDLPFKDVPKDKVIYEHLRGHKHWAADNAQISDEVSWLVMRMCAYDRNGRYATAADLAAAIEEVKSEMLRRGRAKGGEAEATATVPDGAEGTPPKEPTGT